MQPPIKRDCSCFRGLEEAYFVEKSRAGMRDTVVEEANFFSNWVAAEVGSSLKSVFTQIKGRLETGDLKARKGGR